MHPLNMLFDEINHEHWGIPRQGPAPRRQPREPVPRHLGILTEAARAGLASLRLLFRRNSAVADGRSEGAPAERLRVIVGGGRETAASRHNLDRAA
jgi:hypothetical protein